MKKMRLSDIGEGLRSRIESLGYDYVGFESIEEAGRMVLRVYIDLPGGVNLSDCEKTAREINLFLDGR